METPARLAEIRANLIKELFPVALTIGFLEPLSQMRWLISGSPPEPGDVDDLVRLFISTFFVAFAWDWYHRDIVISPVASRFRYVLDVLIVLLYLLFMLAIGSELRWTLFLLLIFAAYVVLDLTSILSDPKNYRADPAWPRARTILSAYAGAFSGRGNRIPAMNLTWAAYLAALFACAGRLAAHRSVAVTIAVGLSVLAIWTDSNHKYAERAHSGHNAGYEWYAWILLAIVLLASYYLYMRNFGVGG